MLYARYPLLLICLLLVIVQLYYGISFYLSGTSMLRMAGGTEGACTNGRAMERETTRYILHSYISDLRGTSRFSLISQVITFVIAAMAAVGISIVMYRQKLGLDTELDTAYVGIMLVFVVVSAMLSLWVIPSYLGGGVARAKGLPGIAEYAAYDEVIRKLGQWIDDNRDAFTRVFGVRITDRILRYKDLDSRVQAQVLYDAASGAELVGYLIFDKKHPDYQDLYQLISGGQSVVVTAFFNKERGLSNEFVPEWNKFKTMIRARPYAATITVKEVDGPSQPAMASEYGVTSYPAIFVQKRGERLVYDGPRTGKDLYAFASDKGAGEILPSDIVYTWRYNPADRMKRTLSVSRTVLIGLFLVMAYILFHVMYQKVPTTYIIGVVIVLFVFLLGYNGSMLLFRQITRG